ncbi:zinc finger, C4 type [Ancylostoma ceylanicum]|uniref:Zinc finger, C4 type n=1 Tax=Ancylostoma ceylanicum TaxID=53326 RepID=A0A0D6MBZ0_9BILA|nr:zinc finger, C4 type [Ancylostoma ceylanicum]
MSENALFNVTDYTLAIFKGKMDQVEAQDGIDGICQICGSPGAQIHYRAMACGLETRKGCKACRFMRCLQANMTEEDVGRLKKRSTNNSCNSVVPYLSAAEIEVKLNELYDALSVGIHFARDLENAPKALDYARTLVRIERLCENPEAARSNFNYSLDVSLAEALERPQLCCARTAIGWDQDEFIEADNLLDILKQIYCRTVTLFADFASACPELLMLEPKDKASVSIHSDRGSTNYCGVVLFTLMYNGYLTNCDGMLFPHGFKYSLSKTKDDHELVTTSAVFMMLGVAWEMKMLEIGMEIAVMPLTDAGNEIVLRARRKYAALLSEYIATTRSDLTAEEQMERLTLLFSTIPHMMHASEYDNAYCGKMVMMNMGNLSGTLSYDLHIRKF